MFARIKEQFSFTQPFAPSLEKNIKVLECRLKPGDAALKRVGSIYRFGYYVVAAAAGSPGGRAVTI